MRLLISFIFLILFTAGCSIWDSGRYYSEEYDFSIKFPEKWALQEGFRNSIVRAENPHYSEDKVFQETINIVADRLPSGMDIDEYHASARSVLQDSFPGLAFGENGTSVIDNRKAYWFTYTYNLVPVEIKSVVYSIMKDGKVFLITCISEEERFDRMKPVFDECAESFKFR